MVNRFGYTWSIATITGGGIDENNDPIPATKTWKDFKCDAQPSIGGNAYVVSQTGDKITISYQVWAMPNQGVTLTRNGLVKDHEGIERIILQTEFNTFSV